MDVPGEGDAKEMYSKNVRILEKKGRLPLPWDMRSVASECPVSVLCQL